MNKALSLDQWLQRLELLHPREIELGLERVAAVANKLQLLPVMGQVISVAGTNGKGSTVAVLEAVLGEMGCLSGACTSPHLFKFNERIRVGGVAVSDDEIIHAFESIDIARAEISLTYFEFATLAALYIFRARGVEVVILEVGLGGRLDAVNIVDANVAVITSIDLDHQDWLGDTRELIAREKAGILRKGQAAVIAETDPPDSLLSCVQSVGCKPYYSGSQYKVHSEGGSWGADLCQLDGLSRQLSNMPAGSLLETNICAALQALLLLGRDFTDQQLSRALDGLALAGRRQLQVMGGREYLLDVAHNPAAIDKLLEYIDVSYCKGRTIALFSCMSDKDIKGMTALCESRFDAWFIADQPDLPRAAKAVEIAAILRAQGSTMISTSKNLRQAFRRAQSLMSEGDRMVIFGSFFTVAGVFPLLEKDRKKERRATQL